MLKASRRGFFQSIIASAAVAGMVRNARVSKTTHCTIAFPSGEVMDFDVAACDPDPERGGVYLRPSSPPEVHQGGKQ